MHHQHTDTIRVFRGKNFFLSNFAKSNVYILVGLKWTKCPTVEHAYQASKTLDRDERYNVVTCKTPLDAKMYGNRVDVVSYWEEVKRVVMLELLRQKFMRHADLRRALKATDGANLREENTWHDNYWGSCTCHECENAGDNWLGQLLMRVRKDLR